MGFLDYIARNLAHISDATTSVNTMRPEAEDPTTALQSALESRRGRRADGFQFGVNPLDDLVIDPTIRVKYTEKLSLVEMTEAVNRTKRQTFDPLASPRSQSRGGVSSFNGEEPEMPAPVEKELFAMTKKVNPHGVRFVGDRVGWDKCLADLAEEERRRQALGDTYIPRNNSADRRRRMRRNEAMRQRVASITNSEFAAMENGDGSANEDDGDYGDDGHDGHYSSDEDNAHTMYSVMDGRGASLEGHDDYSNKIRKLRAPRLQPKNFTHVHRSVGTEDAAAAPDYEDGSHSGKYSYARKSGASSSQSANQPPFAIVGKRAKIIFIVLTFVALTYTIALWAYLSHLRYYFSGDLTFNNGGALWREGQFKTNYDVGGPNTSYAITNITVDKSWIYVNGAYERVKSGSFADTLTEPGSAFTMNAIGVAYLALTVAGIAYAFCTGIYIVCFVNGLWYRSNVGDIIRMRQYSNELRSIDKRAEEAARAIGGGGGGDLGEEAAPAVSPGAMSQGMSPFGFMGSPFGLMHPSWQPEIPENKRIDEQDDLDSRIELKYGWLRPLVIMPISVTDFLLANPSKEKKKGFALIQALFIPSWFLGLIPTIAFFIFVSDAVDNFSVSVLAYSVGSVDIPVYLALCVLSISEFLPALYVYHKFALRFVEARYH